MKMESEREPESLAKIADFSRRRIYPTTPCWMNPALRLSARNAEIRENR
jgi:hypothetical protein